MLNLLAIEPGHRIRLKNGATVEVVENIGDGIWLKAKMPDGEEDLVFCEDVEGPAQARPA
jgi:hypothetical protein